MTTLEDYKAFCTAEKDAYIRTLYKRVQQLENATTGGTPMPALDYNEAIALGNMVADIITERNQYKQRIQELQTDCANLKAQIWMQNDEHRKALSTKYVLRNLQLERENEGLRNELIDAKNNIVALNALNNNQNNTIRQLQAQLNEQDAALSLIGERHQHELDALTKQATPPYWNPTALMPNTLDEWMPYIRNILRASAIYGRGL